MQNISQVPTPSGCCGKTHAKIFEILLIVGFSASVAILVVNLVLTMFIFKYSYFIFFSEIGIAALNFICIIFSIILRVWRSNGSVLDLHYSSSNAISIIILVIVILNLICSLGEDVLYYFIVPLLTMDDPEPSEMIQKIAEKIFNKDLDYDEEDFEKKKIIFKILPYASASFSALVQIISMIFIILIRKRIKYKSDFGIVSNIIQTQALQQSSQNKMSGNNTNLGLGSNNNKNNNIYEGNAKDVKTKKSKKKKKSKDEDNGMVVPDSAQIEIMTKKKKKAKKGKKKKNKSKDKKGKMN